VKGNDSLRMMFVVNILKRKLTFSTNNIVIPSRVVKLGKYFLNYNSQPVDLFRNVCLAM